MVMATRKTFKMQKEKTCLTKHLISMEKKVSESKVAHRKLVEVFERAKEVTRRSKQS